MKTAPRAHPVLGRGVEKCRTIQCDWCKEEMVEQADGADIVFAARDLHHAGAQGGFGFRVQRRRHVVNGGDVVPSCCLVRLRVLGAIKHGASETAAVFRREDRCERCEVDSADGGDDCVGDLGPGPQDLFDPLMGQLKDLGCADAGADQSTAGVVAGSGQGKKMSR